MAEAYALCRTSDELGEDILFLMKPRGEGGGYSANQQRFLTEFYQEEFDKPDDPLGSTQKRDRVPRNKIYAAIMSRDEGIADPSTVVAAISTMYSGFSGYVHGAYGHIMEIYGGMPPRYHLRGLTGAPVIPQAVKGVSNYVLRGAMAIEAIAMLTGDVALVSLAGALSAAIAGAFGLTSASHPEPASP